MKQSIKPHGTQRSRPAAANESAGHDLKAISNGTSSPSVTVGKQTDIVALRTPAAANRISDLRTLASWRFHRWRCCFDNKNY